MCDAISPSCAFVCEKPASGKSHATWIARRAGLAAVGHESGTWAASDRFEGKRQLKAAKMLIDLARRAGNALVIDRIEATVDFEGGAAEEGVLANFQLDGREVTGRIIRIFESGDDADRVVEIELIDVVVHDMDTEETLAHLPPGNETDTTI
jgi:hypothetical protein